MIYFVFLVIAFTLISITSYLKNWKDERPDLKGFGGK